MNSKSENDSSSGGRFRSFLSTVEGQSDDSVSLAEIIEILRSNIKLIGIITGSVFALALIYAFLATPVYRADAMVQIQQQQSPLGGEQSQGLLSMLFPTASPTDAEIQIMNSRSVLVPVINKLHLNIAVNPGGIPIIGRFIAHSDRDKVRIDTLDVPGNWWGEKLKLKANTTGHYTLYSPGGKPIVQGAVGKMEKNPSNALKIDVDKLNLNPGQTVTIVRYADQYVTRLLKRRFSAVELGKDTGIVQLSTTGTNPLKIKHITNAIVQQYIKENIGENSGQAQESLKFVKSQLPDLERQLNTAQQKLAQYQRKYGVINVDQQTKALMEEMTDLQSQYLQLQLEASSLKQRYTDNFPTYIAVIQQEKKIQAKIQALENQVSGLPHKELGYLKLKRKAQVLEKLYTALLSKEQDLRISEAGTLGTARVVDYAVAPIRPIKPKKAVTAILGVLIGLFIGISAAFVRRALYHTIKRAEELENQFHLSVYGIIGHSRVQSTDLRKRKRMNLETMPLLAAEYPDDLSVEAVRSLCTGLDVALMDKTTRIITFTGTAPGVGKSFISANVGHVLGASGKKVLIVDADLRRGHLFKYMNVSQAPGLAEYLRGEKTVEQVIVPSSHNHNVDLIATGERPDNPYELMASTRLSDLLRKCAEEYDYVIVDIPPVLAVAEGLVVARMATANLLVVKTGAQTVREIRTAVNRMSQNKATLLGFVLNDQSRTSHAYGYGRYEEAYDYKPTAE